MRHTPDPVALGLAPGPVTGDADEINLTENTRRRRPMAHSDRCGPTSESKRTRADAAGSWNQRRPGVSIPPAVRRRRPLPCGDRATRIEWPLRRHGEVSEASPSWRQRLHRSV